MKNARFYFLFLIVMTLIGSCSQPDSSSPELEILFEENETDWFKEGDADWRFTNNELIGRLDSGTGFVLTKKTYTNFELTVEFNPDSTINSGVFVRCKNKEISNTDCYEINIWDLHPNQENRTGAVVARAKPLAHVETLNKWNTYKVKCEKGHLQAWVNDVLTVDIQNEELTEGYVGLQAAGTGEVRFRNVSLIVLD